MSNPMNQPPPTNHTNQPAAEWIGSLLMSFSWVCPCGAELVVERLGDEVTCPGAGCGARYRLDGTVHLARRPARSETFPPTLPHLAPGVWLSTTPITRGDES